MFEIGDKVVYPMHGAGIIEGIEAKEILGETQQYYVLTFPIGGMKVMIPTKNVENIGIRQVISGTDFNKVMQVLSNEGPALPDNWNKRYRMNLEKLKTGDIYEVVNVVRDLMLRDHAKGLSTAERKMLNNARQILVSELVLSSSTEEEEIAAMVDRVTLSESENQDDA
ncbi:MAG TPA: CarD family transcriptional regulator [Bacillota bacterium]|nr:CarD family transcriptional regulator [Bacillota bacterium]